MVEKALPPYKNAILSINNGDYISIIIKYKYLKIIT